MLSVRQRTYSLFEGDNVLRFDFYAKIKRIKCMSKTNEAFTGAELLAVFVAALLPLISSYDESSESILFSIRYFVDFLFLNILLYLIRLIVVF